MFVIVDISCFRVPTFGGYCGFGMRSSKRSNRTITDSADESVTKQQTQICLRKRLWETQISDQEKQLQSAMGFTILGVAVSAGGILISIWIL